MSKEEFVSRLSSRLALSDKEVEAIMDATIAEIFTPSIFEPAAGKLGILDTNNCNNNCKEEIARISSIKASR